MIRSLESSALLLLTGLLLTACSGNIRDVSGEPPQATVDGIERRAGALLVDLALRNVNDEPLKIESVGLTLELDGVPLTSGSRDTPLVISARGREVLKLELRGETAGLEKLTILDGGREARLPWTLAVELVIAGGRNFETRTEGWLHPVPGQANRFR